MDINKLIPLLKYSQVRTPQTSETKWAQILKVPQEQIMLSIAFRHDFCTDTQYAIGCAVIHHYRDFCGGLMVESGMAVLDMASVHSYSGYRILGGRAVEDVDVLPHINDLIETPPTTRAGMLTLLEQSVAGAIVSQAMCEGRSMLHFMDKENGKLTAIMDHINTDVLTNVPNACLSAGTGKIQPWREDPRTLKKPLAPAPSASREYDNHVYRPGEWTPRMIRTQEQTATVTVEAPVEAPVMAPVIPRLVESCTEFKEVTVDWCASESFNNPNSGNDVYGAIINLDRQHLTDDDRVTEYCDYCDEEFTFDGFTECPDCSGDLFDESLCNRTTVGRPRSVVEAIRTAFALPGAWKFMPTSLWRCG